MVWGYSIYKYVYIVIINIVCKYKINESEWLFVWNFWGKKEEGLIEVCEIDGSCAFVVYV